MKNKLKIMNHKPHLSDEEINAYKDFSAVLSQYDRELKGANRWAYRRWAAMGTVCILIVAVSIWVGQRRDQSATPLAQPQGVRVFPPKKIEKAGPAGDSGVRRPAAKPKDREVTPPYKAESAAPVAAAPIPQSTAPAETGYVQAEPVHGYPELYEYFSAQLVYPAEALKDSVQGVLTVSFVINREGHAENIEVLKSLGPAFDKEVKRLIQGMPAWKPAALNGRPVPSRMSLPITFQYARSGK